jgi:hypothetical protein
MFTGLYAPGTAVQLVLLPYEVSGPNSTMAWPTQPLTTDTCATNGFAVFETVVPTAERVIEPPQANVNAVAIDRAAMHNNFDQEHLFIGFLSWADVSNSYHRSMILAKNAKQIVIRNEGMTTYARRLIGTIPIAPTIPAAI